MTMLLEIESLIKSTVFHPLMTMVNRTWEDERI